MSVVAPRGSAPSVLTVPADTSYLATVRVFAGAFGRANELPEAAVDDLKLVLSELCAGALDEVPGGDQRLEISSWVEDGEVQIRWRGVGMRPDTFEGGNDHRRQLLRALVPEADYRSLPDATEVRFSIAQRG